MLVFIASTDCQATDSWAVAPRVCVAQDNTDACAMRVNISVPEISDEHCVLIEDRLLRCVAPGVSEITLNLSLETAVTLRVQDAHGKTVSTSELNIQYRSSQKRRRIRTPWNIF